MATSWLGSLACTTGRAPVCSTRCAGNAIKSELACVEFSSYSMEEAMYNKLRSLNTWYFSSMKLWPVPSLLSFSFGISKESNKSVGYPEQPAANTRALIGVFSATHKHASWWCMFEWHCCLNIQSYPDAKANSQVNGPQNHLNSGR